MSWEMWEFLLWFILLNFVVNMILFKIIVGGLMGAINQFLPEAKKNMPSWQDAVGLFFYQLAPKASEAVGSKIEEWGKKGKAS